MKKLLSFALIFALLLTLLGCQKVSLPYDLKGTVSVEVLAFNNDSCEPFAQFIAEGKDAEEIVERFSSLTLKELNYMEPSIRGYEFWFRDETGSDIAKIELPYGPSPLVVVGGTPYQDINSGVDIQYIGQLVDTVSTSSLEK